MSRVLRFPPLRRLASVAFFSLLTPLAASAIDLDVKLEPGVALPLSQPQSQRFDVGGAASLKGLVGFEHSYLSLAGGLTFVGLAAQSGYPNTSAGIAWAPSFGFRIQRPRETLEARDERMEIPQHEFFNGVRPWLDADILYVRTGGLDRAGFQAALGLAFPLGAKRAFWLGPFVRYFQIFQDNQANRDDRDAKVLIVGLSLEVGARFVQPTRVAEPPPAPICPAVVAVAVAAAPLPVSKPDRDGDGTPDDIDACPDVQGPPTNSGCPVYERVTVKPDRLELKEKIQFADNSSEIDPVSHPLLDEVAKALQDIKGARVVIEGHASSEGLEARNEKLSTERAHSVLTYLARHGIARERLSSKGFSSSRPLETNSTESGREANRRVDFVVHFLILKEESPQ